jgi:hypothetical protein
MAASLFTFTLTKIGMSRAGLVGANDYSVTEIRELQRRLKTVNPILRTELIRDAKKAGEPVQLAVKSAIAAVTPLSGMTQGRLNWNLSVDAKGKGHKSTDVKLQFRTRSSGRSDVTSLVRVQVASPAVVMADMAGRSRTYMGAGYKGSGQTREYAYKGGTRTHRVDGRGIKNPKRQYKFARQGDALLQNLGGSASRYVWPAAENKIPAVRSAIESILRDAYTKINRKGL